MRRSRDARWLIQSLRYAKLQTVLPLNTVLKSLSRHTTTFLCTVTAIEDLVQSNIISMLICQHVEVYITAAGYITDELIALAKREQYQQKTWSVIATPKSPCDGTR